MDWCHTGTEDPAVVYADMSRALNATGRHIHFNLCRGSCDPPSPPADGGGGGNGTRCPWAYGPAIAQSWRMDADHTWCACGVCTYATACATAYATAYATAHACCMMLLATLCMCSSA